MNLFEAFELSVTKHQNIPAIIDKKTSQNVSFITLLALVKKQSEALHYVGVKNQTKVLVAIPMSLELYINLLALFRLGACVVFIDPAQDKKFINSALTQLKCDVFLGIPKAFLLLGFIKSLRNIPLKIATKKLPFIKHIDTTKTKAFNYKVKTEQNALITFTSGSTGAPKAIPRSHSFLLTQYDALKEHIKLQSATKDLSTLPIFVLANLFGGLSSVLANTSLSKPKKVNPLALSEAIKEEKVTRVGASPAFFKQLLQSDSRSIESLKSLYLGGAPVMPSLLNALHIKLPLCSLDVLYGSSEAEPISSYNYTAINTQILKKMQEGHGLFVGKVTKETKLKILDQENGIGEITVAGKHVVQSYINPKHNKENKLLIEDTIYHKTGDMGYLDENTNLWLCGRKSASIHDDKGVLYPFCVEVAADFVSNFSTALLCHKNKRILYVESPENLKLKQQLQEVLQWAKLDKIICIKEIPKDKRHNSKIDYIKLKSMI